MALKQGLTLNNGIDCLDAYHRVIEVFLSYKDNMAGFQLASYVNEQARLDGKAPLQVRPYQIYNVYDESLEEGVTFFSTYFSIEAMDAENHNCVSQCYEYLKTLDEFALAVDV